MTYGPEFNLKTRKQANNLHNYLEPVCRLNSAAKGASTGLSAA